MQLGPPLFDFCATGLDTGKNWNSRTIYFGADTESSAADTIPIGARPGFAEDTDPDCEKGRTNIKGLFQFGEQPQIYILLHRFGTKPLVKPVQTPEKTGTWTPKQVVQSPNSLKTPNRT